MDKKLSEMDITELHTALAEQEDLLEEYRDEREMFLSQSGQHISSTGLVKKYAELEAKTLAVIAEINRLISDPA